MILLLGGTAETAPLASLLAEAGYEVLVSTATAVPLAIGDHPRIHHREGPLDKDSLAALSVEKHIDAIVDAAHPYAENAHANARAAAILLHLPCLRYVRPSLLVHDKGTLSAASHEEAARLAFSLGRPVLLTTGSRNLRPYAAAARETRRPLIVRVLDAPESLLACRTAGIPPEHTITGRGPFAVEENIRLIRKFDIGVLVTKDSGEAGGVAAKQEAARREGCTLVIVTRPEMPDRNTFETMNELLSELRRQAPPRQC